MITRPGAISSHTNPPCHDVRRRLNSANPGRPFVAAIKISAASVGPYGMSEPLANGTDYQLNRYVSPTNQMRGWVRILPRSPFIERPFVYAR